MRRVEGRRDTMLIRILIGLLALSCAGPAVSAPPAKPLDKRVEALKQRALELDRDLSRLEEELLFAGDTQVAVFVSLADGEGLVLDSMRLLIDGSVRAGHLYEAGQVDALRRGGVQRLYLGQLRPGPHKLTASFIAHRTGGKEYRDERNVVINKGEGAKYVELKVTGGASPRLNIAEWE